MTPTDFAAFLALARAHDVDEFSIGELAVKFAPRTPVIDERKSKEPSEPRTALDMLNDPPRFDTSDVVTGPGVTSTEKPTGPSTPIQWADDEPARGDK